MSASLRYFVFSCFIFLVFQQVATGITCYYCNTCGSSSNSWTTTSNTTSGSQCYKYAYSYGIISYVNRDVRDPCSPGADGLGGVTTCCSNDYCNKGVSLSSSVVLAFALVAIINVFKTGMIN